jgi:hypothetical protein
LTKSELVLLCSGPMSLHPHVKSDLLVSTWVLLDHCQYHIKCLYTIYWPWLVR